MAQKERQMTMRRVEAARRLVESAVSHLREAEVEAEREARAEAADASRGKERS
jgi:hypothetical protein